MLFARLLESQRALMASRATIEGAAVSALSHALLIVGWLVVHRDVTHVDPEPQAQFSPVEYFVPRDRIPAMRPQRETVTWTTLSRVAGAGFEQAVRDESAETKRELEIVVPPGKKSETEAAMKEFEELPPIVLGDSIMTELQVDSAVVRYEGSAAPSYPEALLQRRIEGTVVVQYVVDTLGRADTATLRVVSATHPDFVRAVKVTLPSMRFRPAMMASRLVPQLVQQPFSFKIVDTTRAPSRPPPLLHDDPRSAVSFRHEVQVRTPAARCTQREVVQGLDELRTEVRRPVQGM
ncbi:MAG TPA: TonB family protein [Gemmatimonadaceae bacterium]